MESQLVFPENMYVDTYGSFLITKVILKRLEVEEAKKLWKARRKVKGKQFIKETEDTTNMCLVKSKFNTLIMPWIEIESEKVILPLREDGVYPLTYRHLEEVIFG